MSSDQLGLAQKGVQIIRFLSLWLFILVLVMFGLAIYLATGRRRETLRNVGFAFVLVGLLVLVVRELVGNYVIGGLTDTPSLDRTGHHVWVISTSILTRHRVGDGSVRRGCRHRSGVCRPEHVRGEDSGAGWRR